jgi:hypothetical protein
MGAGYNRIRKSQKNKDYDCLALVTHDFKLKYWPPLEENSEIENLADYNALGVIWKP